MTLGLLFSFYLILLRNYKQDKQKKIIHKAKFELSVVLSFLVFVYILMLYTLMNHCKNIGTHNFGRLS